MATTVLMAMRTTEVGVAVFSEMRKRSVRTEKEQMSMPEPEMDVKMPPMKPAARRMSAFQLRMRLAHQ